MIIINQVDVFPTTLENLGLYPPFLDLSSDLFIKKCFEGPAIPSASAFTELLKLLADRLIHPVPRLLDVALHAWAGERSEVNLAGVTVLQCAQPAIFDAIVNSAKLRPFLRGELAPNLVVVNEAQLEALREQLRWTGLEISAELSVKQSRR